MLVGMLLQHNMMEAETPHQSMGAEEQAVSCLYHPVQSTLSYAEVPVVPNYIDQKEKEKSSPFGDHDRSLLRQQPGAPLY